MSTIRDYVDKLVLSEYTSEPLKLSRNDLIFSEGEEDDSVFFLKEGEVKIMKGKWVLWSAKSNELLGITSFFSEIATYSFTAKASQDCVVYKISKVQFKELLLNNPEFSRAVMDLLCARIALTNSRTKSLLEHPSRYRLIQEIIRRTREINKNWIPYNLEDLSGVVGVSVRLVRDMISDLEQKKLLERTKERLIVHDLKGLEIIARIK